MNCTCTDSFKTHDNPC